MQFQDSLLSDKTINEIFNGIEFDLPYTEIKYENTIDANGIANPRQQERVPAEAEFDFKIVYKNVDL